MRGFNKFWGSSPRAEGLFKSNDYILSKETQIHQIFEVPQSF